VRKGGSTREASLLGATQAECFYVIASRVPADPYMFISVGGNNEILVRHYMFFDLGSREIDWSLQRIAASNMNDGQLVDQIESHLNTSPNLSETKIVWLSLVNIKRVGFFGSSLYNER
jgi:hypothetical protein